MASAVGQQGSIGSVSEALTNQASIQEGIEASGGEEKLISRYWKMLNPKTGQNKEPLEDILKVTEKLGIKTKILERYAEKVRKFLDIPLDANMSEKLWRLERQFWAACHDDSEQSLENFLSQVETQEEPWIKVFLLSRFTSDPFLVFGAIGDTESINEAMIARILNELKECVPNNPTKFDFVMFINWLEYQKRENIINYDFIHLAVSLQLQYLALPKEVPLDEDDVFLERLFGEVVVDEIPPACLAYRFYLENNFKVKDLLEVRDQAEVDRFQRIFNRIDFMLVWEEKATSRSGVGILNPDLVQKIAKCLTWPQVVWELRDDEKSFDAEQNPIYRQALQQRQIANETAKRILGSASRASETRVEELDGQPKQKRARTAENPQI